MKLPNAVLAVVEREKVVDYLLNRIHRYGASKAEFFSKYGYRLEKWELTAQVEADPVEIGDFITKDNPSAAERNVRRLRDRIAGEFQHRLTS